MIRKMPLLERTKLAAEIVVVAVVVPFSGRYRHIMRSYRNGLVRKFHYGLELQGENDG